MNHREAAKRILKHYLDLLASAAGLRLDWDNMSDIDLLVDHLVEAAKEELQQEAQR